MTVSDTELLRRYTDRGSDDAFTELVARHLDLVHSAALRQVDGDATAAADIAQGVFTDLARKARQLTGHTSLTGWLYTSTRFQAANVRRTERRRKQREHQAQAMNQLLQSDSPEPDWDQLRPALDDTMHELDDPDREAVLWRYFERCSHAEIGSRLGVSENAARMRVDRALEKLRAGLVNRGIHSTGAALGLALSQHGVAAAPQGMVAEVSQAALAAQTATGKASTAGWLQRWRVPLAFGALVLLFLVPVARSRWSRETPSSADLAATTPTADSSVEAASGTATVSGAGPNQAVVGSVAPATRDNEAAGGPALLLTVVAADSGKPIPNVPINLRSWEGDRFAGRKLVTLRDGTCRVTYTTNTSDLQLTTQAEGFTAVRLAWDPKRGETIPAAYTLKLGRPVKLGGKVIDADGQPVAGATVGFNHTEDPALAKRPESYEFGWIEVATDEAGRWEINRIAEEMVRRIYGGARHPDHLDSPHLSVSQNAAAEAELRNGTHVFQLGRTTEIIGVVVDSDGQPIAGAKAAVGHVGSSDRRETTTEADGTFTLRAWLGEALLSANAQGYAATTERIDIKPGAGPYRLLLKPGAALRLRLVNREGQPIAQGYAWLDTFQRGPIDPDRPAPPPVQADVNLRSDDDGRVVWEDAPDAELSFDLYAKGYMRVSGYRVRPDGQERTVTLPSALTVFGSVVDADTGEAIPKFRMITGWPQLSFSPKGAAATNAAWSTLERFWITFAGGEYRHSYDEPVIGGIDNPGYILKFEAEGYAPFVSRTIGANEGEVRLDVALRPAAEKTITVVTPQGIPARQAQVALVGPGGQASFDGQSFDPNGSPGTIRVLTDAKGEFRLPADDTLRRIFVLHESGFLEVSPSQSSGETTWSLLPWGAIAGLWMAGDHPVVNGEVAVQGLEGIGDALQFDFRRFRLSTDAEGRFGCDRVPPGKVKLVRLHRTDQGGGRTSWRHGQSKEIEIKPGEVTSVSLGNAGYTVSVRLRWPAGIVRGAGWQISGGLHTSPPAHFAEAMKHPEELARLQQTSEFREFVKNMRQAHFSIQGDVATADEVEPGDYEATVIALEETASGGPIQPKFVGRMRASVPADPGSGRLDLGELVIEPFAPPVAAGQ